MPTQTADPHLVARATGRITNTAKYLARGRKVARNHTVESHHGDHVRFSQARKIAVWLKSFEHCLFRHSSKYRTFHTIRMKGRFRVDFACNGCHELRGPHHRRPHIRAADVTVARTPRRTFNAMFVAGACGVYLSGGFGRWELLYPMLALPVAFIGLRSYRFIRIAWLMHACMGSASTLVG